MNRFKLFCGLLLLLFSSCRKDSSPPTVEIYSLLEMTITASPGDSIVFEGRFSDPKRLGRLEMVELVNNSTQTLLKTIEDFDSKRSHEFREVYWVGANRQSGDEIQIDFIGYDQPGNNSIGRRTIRVQ